MSNPATPLPAEEMLNVPSKEALLLVAVSGTILAILTLNANPNVLLMRSVLMTRHASTSTAETHVLVFVALMPNAMSQTTIQTANVIQVTLEMHLWHASELQHVRITFSLCLKIFIIFFQLKYQLKLLILATHPLVDQMQFAQKEIELLRADVSPNILEIHMWHVDLNAPSIQNVHQTRRAATLNVLILVLDFVE